VTIVLVGEAAIGPACLLSRFESAAVQVIHRHSLDQARVFVQAASPSTVSVVVELAHASLATGELSAALHDLCSRAATVLVLGKDLPDSLVAQLPRLGNLRFFPIGLQDADCFRTIMDAVAPGSMIGLVPRLEIAAEAKASPVAENHPVTERATNANEYSEDFLRRVGLSDVPVLLHGETGVGKEVMARRLLAYSHRANKPFLKLNCTALPADLIESELFGYDKGAFTGATSDKPGKFELAQNGTILFDEIGDMDIRLQAKLLQVLQDGEIQPLGSARVIKVNVRVMAATHRDLRLAIAQGRFREDLYYRLSVINITVPPLRQRRHEILPLAQQLLLRHVEAGSKPPEIPLPLQEAILAYPWPGHVRELENLMRRFLIYQEANKLIAELKASLLVAMRRRSTDRIAEVPRQPLSFHRVAEESRVAESKLLIEALESARWNRRRAAMLLNLDYKALLYKLQKYGIVEVKPKRRHQTG
jgi:DNA-binding NtrC family response regulator